MAKIIGFSRNLKLPWLNKAAELVSEGLTEQEIKDQLNKYLSFELKSPTNTRKTREILMNIWVYENERDNKIKSCALKLIKAYPQYALEIHWCMMMTAYPVFADICRLIGKISEFQDEIAPARLKQKLFDLWGERSTLFYSIDKLFATFKALDVITCCKPGRYRINTHKVSNPEITAFLIYTMMTADGSSYYTFADINSSAYLFPFEYKMEKEALLRDGRFAINNFGGELSVSLNN